MVARSGLPDLYGEPIEVCFLPSLRAWRGRLLSGEPRGSEVYGGSLLRQRKIVLDRALKRRPDECARVFVHELFHFAWLRLGNPRRRSFEEMIAREIRRRTRGELGWSAELRKLALHPRDLKLRTRRWREYICESFCDTAARPLGGQGPNPEVT